MIGKFLELPETEVFVDGRKLCYSEGPGISVNINEPDLVTISKIKEALINRGWNVDDHDISDGESLYRKKIIDFQRFISTTDLFGYSDRHLLVMQLF